MFLTETAPAPEGPVPLARFREHLRLAEGFAEDSAEDALLTHFLATATAEVERRTGQALVARGFLLRVAAWDRTGCLTLPVGPVATIESLSFTGSGDPLDQSTDGLCLAPGTTGQRLSAAGGLPPIPAGRVAELRFTAGYGAASAVPADLGYAVLLLAARHFSDRDAEAKPGLPAPVAALLDPHRRVRI
ncbi:MAG: hypothetical protein ACFBSD_03280 [Paracoccaceae bacterium]